MTENPFSTDVGEFMLHTFGLSSIEYSLPFRGVEPRCYVNGEPNEDGAIKKHLTSVAMNTRWILM